MNANLYKEIIENSYIFFLYFVTSHCTLLNKERFQVKCLPIVAEKRKTNLNIFDDVEKLKSNEQKFVYTTIYM